MRFSDADGSTRSCLSTHRACARSGRVRLSAGGVAPARGVFIGSVPTTPSVDANPNHLHDFTESSFRSMLRRRPTEVANFRQTQPFDVIPLLQRTEARTGDLRRDSCRIPGQSFGTRPQDRLDDLPRLYQPLHHDRLASSRLNELPSGSEAFRQMSPSPSSSCRPKTKAA